MTSTAVPTGGRDSLGRRAVRSWLRTYAPTAEMTLSPAGWKAIEDVLFSGVYGAEPLADLLTRPRGRDPYLRISDDRWRALRGELREPLAAQRQAAQDAVRAQQAEAEAEVLAQARALLNGRELPAEATTARALFASILAGIDTNRAKREYRRLAQATHPDQGGNQQVFGELAAAWADYRARMHLG